MEYCTGGYDGLFRLHGIWNMEYCTGGYDGLLRLHGIWSMGYALISDDL
jgi:hypothetical protein